jgi:anti-sigma B factor antagonist
MTQTSLEATTHAADGTVRIELRGDIDGSAGDTLNAAYGQTAGADAVLLDFAAVDYINSTGIALIVGLLARARADARPVSARGLSEHYREIFEITRLSDFMTILADEQSPQRDEQGGTR